MLFINLYNSEADRNHWALIIGDDKDFFNIKNKFSMKFPQCENYCDIAQLQLGYYQVLLEIRPVFGQLYILLHIENVNHQKLKTLYFHE